MNAVHSRAAAMDDRADGFPSNRRIRSLALAAGVTEVTLPRWRVTTLADATLERNGGQTERRSGLEKRRMVLESAPTKPSERSKSCHRTGSLHDDTLQWRTECEQVSARTRVSGSILHCGGATRERHPSPCQIEVRLQRRSSNAPHDLASYPGYGPIAVSGMHRFRHDNTNARLISPET